MMKRLFPMIALIVSAALLTGCADQIAKFKQTIQTAVTVYERVTTATVEPTKIVVLATAFNGVKSVATSYLRYCKTNLAASICSADNRRATIKWVRKGTDARNQLEPYIIAGGAGPGDIYNILVDSINQLNQLPIAKAGAAS